jgi:hypothetical protein
LGYEEGIETTPTKKQWERLKARVAEIDSMPTTQTVFVDRYYRDYYRQPVWMTNHVMCAGATSYSVGAHPGVPLNAGAGGYTGAVFDAGHTHPVWNSAVAMNELGHEDAKADAA